MTFLCHQICIGDAFFSFFSLITVQPLLFFADKGIHESKWVFGLHAEIDFIEDMSGGSVW